MNYTEIISAAVNYSDRTDAATASNLDSFLLVVESRVNKRLKTQEQGSRTSLPILTGQTLFDMPADFAGLRDISVKSADRKRTLKYTTPEGMNNLEDNPSALYQVPENHDQWYSIIANQIQIFPEQLITSTIELVYYKKVPNLNPTAANNWLSDNHPECYIFGLMVEISSYAKDTESAIGWDARFKEAMDDIYIDDQKSRWSGPPLQVQVI